MRGALVVIGTALGGCFVKPDSAVGGNGAPIAYVKSFVARHDPTNQFVAAADRAGDAVVIHLACASGIPIASFQVAASGWAFTELGPLTVDPSGLFAADSFAAIAPNTDPIAFLVSSTPDCGGEGIVELGDEFTNNDRRGGSATFNASASYAGSQESVVIAVPHARGAVWAAMTTGNAGVAGPDFVMASMVMGNPTEYQVHTEPAGDVIVTFAGGSPPHAITAISILNE